MKTFACLVFAVLALFLQARQLDPCTECHDDVVVTPFHGENATCSECHPDVVDESHEDKTPAPAACVECHDEIADAMKHNVHSRLSAREGREKPSCAACHGGHNILEVTKVGNLQESFCGDCHDNLLFSGPFHDKKFVPDQDCVDCHEDEGDFHKLPQSVHKELACVDCHQFIADNLEAHEDGISFLQRADCSTCHGGEAVKHRDSIHGISLAEGVDEAAACWGCHGGHEVLSVADEASAAHRGNLVKTCAVCHDQPEFLASFSLSNRAPGAQFNSSIHGKLLAEGNEDAPDCINCHGTHDIKNRLQPGSSISMAHIPETCGNCHKEIAEEYKSSIHWKAARKGIKQAPVCTDCHTEHGQESGATVGKKQQARKIQEETCFHCHQDPMLAKKFLLRGQEPGNYRDSYHGLAFIKGDDDAATCIDCHGGHKILPKAHPESMIHADRVLETCQTCHENATGTFAASYSHQLTGSAHTIQKWVRTLYILLIVLVIGFMLVHNGIILVFELRRKRARSKQRLQVQRMTMHEVVQHFFLVLFFVTLVVTGFALKFPETWWAQGLQSLGMDESVRQGIHRYSGLLMLLLGGYHIGYLCFSQRGRRRLKQLLPVLADLRALPQNMAYHLGISKKKPQSHAFDYTEKAEYWALVWGTLIMGVTGLILWFPESVGGWAPVWFIKVCELFHFYEAILATLAILVWHLFFVMFHPSEYPLSFTMVDGQMDLRHFQDHHGLQFEDILHELKQVQAGGMNPDKVSFASRSLLDALAKQDIALETFLEKQQEGKGR